MSMDYEFLELVRNGGAAELSAMLDDERAKFHVLAAEHAAEYTWLSCCVHSYASKQRLASELEVKQLARATQAMRAKMDAAEERIGVLRNALYRAFAP
jgi:transcriptional regulator of acetoin/glycerol metabolism